MKLAVMQPYFLPYIGYWQLISSVDTFVVYDNIQYTKKGWFNRNRILENGHDRLFTIPIKKDSDYLDVHKRFLSAGAHRENERTLRIIQANYKKAPHFTDAYPLIEQCFLCPNENLFDYIYNSIRTICNYLDITTPIVVSSTVPIDHTLKAEQKVLAICKAMNADVYINAIGGMELYNKQEFASQGVALQFIKSRPVEYAQFGNPFVPWLSIIDIVMFNSKDAVRGMLGEYDLL
ncbi:MAG TPA: WbqC family protein [Candidatus Saccharimonadales bacterium]|nr:WbqC family protein [Candidatus Saccharimonadales bacterium]